MNKKRLDLTKKLLHDQGSFKIYSIFTVPCLNCSKPVKNKFCNPQCQQEYYFKLKVIKIESLQIAPNHQAMAKRYMLYKFGHSCMICKLIEWKGLLIPLVLDHKDGNSTNWSLSNLRLICANCDRQQPTFGNKNKGKGRRWKVKLF